MRLSAPRFITFLISTLLVALAVVSLFVPAVPEIPYVTGNERWFILAGYLLLWLGTLFPGM